LAGTLKEVELDVPGEVTISAILDQLEAGYPMLKGTIRDQGTGHRRPFIRFYAGQEDISHDPTDQPLPDAVASGREPLMVVGAMSGG
jgi:molybdopterin synthase sulfur carrier subunit